MNCLWFLVETHLMQFAWLHITNSYGSLTLSSLETFFGSALGSIEHTHFHSLETFASACRSTGPRLRPVGLGCFLITSYLKFRSTSIDFLFAFLVSSWRWWRLIYMQRTFPSLSSFEANRRVWGTFLITTSHINICFIRCSIAQCVRSKLNSVLRINKSECLWFRCSVVYRPLRLVNKFGYLIVNQGEGRERLCWTFPQQNIRALRCSFAVPQIGYNEKWQFARLRFELSEVLVENDENDFSEFRLSNRIKE